jgi:hypothetical protein
VARKPSLRVAKHLKPWDSLAQCRGRPTELGATEANLLGRGKQRASQVVSVSVSHRQLQWWTLGGVQLAGAEAAGLLTPLTHSMLHS